MAEPCMALGHLEVQGHHVDADIDALICHAPGRSRVRVVVLKNVLKLNPCFLFSC